MPKSIQVHLRTGLMEKGCSLAVSFFLLSVLLVSTPSVAGESIQVDVLFDFGDGSYLWSLLTLRTNASAMNATETAAAMHGLRLDVIHYSFGDLVTSIGNYSASFPSYWHFYVWNNSNELWEMAQVGASDLLLNNGDSIAWLLGPDREASPQVYESPSPVLTPLWPHPSTQFRYGAWGNGATASEAPNTNTLQWAVNTSSFEIDSSITSGGGVVFVATRSGTKAYDEDTGIQVWANDLVRASTSTPALFGDYLYVGGSDGAIYALGAGNGSVVWSTRLQQGAQFTGIASSPRVVEGVVYVGTFNETGGPGSLYAIDAYNGSIIWRLEKASIHMSTASVKGDMLFVGLAGLFDPQTLSYAAPYGLLAVNKTSGEELWLFETPGPVMSSPALSSDRIFVTTRSGQLYALDFNGNELWNQTIRPSTSSPGVFGDWIVVGSGTFGPIGQVAAFRRDGQKAWEKDVGGGVQSSPAIADGKVFISTNNDPGRVLALDLSTGREIWSLTPEPFQYILSSPIVSNGRLFIASDNGWVYSIGDPAPKLIDLTMQAEISKLLPRQTYRLWINYSNSGHGLATNLVIRLNLTGPVEIMDTSTPYEERERELQWTVDSIGLGEAGSIRLDLRSGDSPEGRVAHTVVWNYSDAQGTPYPELSSSLEIALSSETSLPLGFIMIAASLIVVVVAIAVSLWYWRRERGGARP